MNKNILAKRANLTRSTVAKTLALNCLGLQGLLFAAVHGVEWCKDTKHEQEIQSLRPCAMFAGKAGTYLNEAPFGCSTLG